MKVKKYRGAMDIPDGQATEIEHAIHVYFK